MKTSIQRLGNITIVGLRSIARNKMRSLLTALGVVIGVACVIVSVAIGSGVAASVSEMINSLGSNFIMIMPGAATQGGARIFTGQSTLTEQDAEAIKNEAPAVAYVSPQMRTGAQVVAGDMNWSTQIMGVGIDWPFIRAWNVDEGAFFTESDVKSGAKVAVLGKTVADNLFPGGGAVGSIIRIKNVPFRVIGVLEKKGGSMMGSDQDDQIVAPYTTVMKRVQGTSRLGIVLDSSSYVVYV
jgi:putative ABC transport system permease protein